MYIKYILTACFTVIDFITGIVKAIKNKEFCSTVMREGLFHKFGLVIVVVLGTLIDFAQGYMDLGFTIPIATPICIYVSLMEIGSVIENLYAINTKIIPEKIQEFFKKINAIKAAEKENSKDENEK